MSSNKRVSKKVATPKPQRSLSPSHRISKKHTASPIRRASPISLNLDEVLPEATSRPSSPTQQRNSPLRRREWEDIKNGTVEEILINFKYEPLMCVECDDEEGIEFIICRDPTGNIVYVDVRGEEDLKFESNNFKIVECTHKEHYSIDESIVNSYKDVVKNDIYGVVIHSDNELIIINQDDEGEHNLDIKELKTNSSKRRIVSPLILLSDAVAGCYEDNDFTIVDCAEQTLKIRNLIREKQVEEVAFCLDNIVDSLNEQLSHVKELQAEYNSCFRECVNSQKDFEKDCLSFYEKFDTIGLEGRTEEEIYNVAIYNSCGRDKFLSEMNSNILGLSDVIGDIKKINDKLENKIKTIKSSKKVLDSVFEIGEIDYN